MTTYYIVIGVFFVASFLTAPLIKMRVKKAAAKASNAMEPYARNHGFFSKALLGNVKFEFGDQDESEFEQIEINFFGKVIVLPEGPIDIYIRKGSITYKDWKYTIEGFTVADLDIKAGYVYSVELLPKKEAKKRFSKIKYQKVVFEHLLTGMANPGNITLYVIEQHYQSGQ